jgi:hypothetical protein
LESYLFTKEAFADVKRCLEPDGLFVMYNFFRNGWLVARLQQTLTDVFGVEPLVFVLPYRPTVEPKLNWDGFTLFIAGSQAALEPIRQAFASPDLKVPLYLIDVTRPQDADTINGFHPESGGKAERSWLPIGLAQVQQPDDLDEATDDWPFLYLRGPMIPMLSVRGGLIMAGIALLLLAWFAPPRTSDLQTWREELRHIAQFWTRRSNGRSFGFDGRMFFLGAGFMLVETKAVVHMALVFGSTWMVNSVVFLAVLIMILAANLFVLFVRPKRLWHYYLALFVTLLLNVLVPLNSFLGWPFVWQIVASCLLVFAPIFFAGVIFAMAFSKGASADRAFGFNIAGAMLGGLSEYSSMLLGFRYLLLVALAFYALSALWRGSLRDQETIEMATSA